MFHAAANATQLKGSVYMHVSPRTLSQLQESNSWYDERHVRVGAWKSRTKPIS